MFEMTNLCGNECVSFLEYNLCINNNLFMRNFCLRSDEACVNSFKVILFNDLLF